MDIEVSTCSTECGLICVRIANQTSCLSEDEARDLLAKLQETLQCNSTSPPPSQE